MKDNEEVTGTEDESGTQEIDVPDSLLALGDGEEAEATETDADEENAATSADAAEEEQPTPPTAESLGLDLKLAKDKAAYDELLKTFGRWTNKFLSKHKQSALASVQEQQQAQPARPEQGAEQWDPYTVPADKFTYTVTPEPEGSDLHGFEEGIMRIARQVFDQGLAQTMSAMRANDGRLREQTEQMTVAEKLNAFGAAIKDHPDVEARRDDIIQFVKETESVAQKNPERWKKLFKAEFGFGEDWRDEADDTAAAQAQRGQQHQRIAKKPLANMVRSTSAARPVANIATRRDMTSDEAAEANWQRLHARGLL